MNEATLQLDLPILLPEVEDEKDQCVDRLREEVVKTKGIRQVHIEHHNSEAYLCFHYDSDLISLDGVKRLVEKAGAEVTKRYNHETLRLRGMDCADCARSIEHILNRLPGLVTVSVNYAAEKIRVEYDSDRVSHEEIVKRVNWLGYRIEEERERTWLERNRELVLALLSALFLGIGFTGERFLGLPEPGAIAFYVLAYVTAGYDIARHGVGAVLNLRFDIDFMMMAAALGAAVLGKWAEGAFLLVLFSLGHALEHYAMDRARSAVRALGEVTPKTARAIRAGTEAEIPVEELERGDTVIVRSGERIPIDGEITEGRSAVDQSPVTGESVPVEKGAGDTVYAGAVNGDGTMQVRVTKLATDTTMARMIKLVEEAQTQKSPTQYFTDRFQRVFVPAVLTGVLALALVPPLVGWLSWEEALLRAITLLVAASPCALAIATPSAVLAGIAQAARKGVLIKGGAHLENLGKLDAMALDKTGTITRGEPQVTDLVPLNGSSEDELLGVAAAVERRSNHPLARAVVQQAEALNLDGVEAENLQSVTGRGVIAELESEKVRIGNMSLFSEAEIHLDEGTTRQVEEMEAAGKTTMIVQRGERFLGIIGLADQPRENARETFARLRRLGVRSLIMLTGDNERVASAIAKQVELTDYRANLLPEQKVEAIKALLEEHKEVAMVGDGVNDAPALATATVGIAMGGAGTDVALETADIALMADDISKLPFAVGLSRQSNRIIRQNLFISLGVIVALIPIAVFGLASIGPAIILHEGSTLLVVFNALRLLGFQTQ